MTVRLTDYISWKYDLWTKRTKKVVSHLWDIIEAEQKKERILDEQKHHGRK